MQYDKSWKMYQNQQKYILSPCPFTILRSVYESVEKELENCFLISKPGITSAARNN
jgi:hypothetical protein